MQPNTSIPESRGLPHLTARVSVQLGGSQFLKFLPVKTGLREALTCGGACGALLLGSSLNLSLFGCLRRPSVPVAEGSLGTQVREITMEAGRRNDRPVKGEKRTKEKIEENGAGETGPGGY